MMQNLETEASRRGAAPVKAPTTSHHAMVGDRTEPEARSTAIYIAQMAAELIKLARRERLDLLTHLLEMAKLEAEFSVGAR
ncbi:hypothetical protein [Methylocella tundrae]